VSVGEAQPTLSQVLCDTLGSAHTDTQRPELRTQVPVPVSPPSGFTTQCPPYWWSFPRSTTSSSNGRPHSVPKTDPVQIWGFEGGKRVSCDKPNLKTSSHFLAPNQPTQVSVCVCNKMFSQRVQLGVRKYATRTAIDSSSAFAFAWAHTLSHLVTHHRILFTLPKTSRNSTSTVRSTCRRGYGRRSRELVGLCSFGFW
jgi:hypothetical protein